MTTLDFVLNGLMHRYTERVPDVKKITHKMLESGIITHESEIQNDHIAFRTLGVPHLGIASFEKIFLALGYKKMEYYYFKEKKLNAYWYAPPSDEYPRIFISELIVDQLSAQAQDIIKKYTMAIKNDPVDFLDLSSGQQIDDFLHQPLWQTPTWDDFKILQQESEYAAWVIYNRYYLNHYTISVHDLKPPYNTVIGFNEFLENMGIKLNSAGGKIKTSPDGKLLQSSTVAQLVSATFADGDIHNISGSYVEFAERKVLHSFIHLPYHEIKRMHRREGFEASNADKIFESTFSSQTGS